MLSEKFITEAFFTFCWLCLGLIPARIAWSKGRAMLAWWLMGMFIWPVLIPIAAFIRRDEEALKEREESDDPERAWRNDLRIGLIVALIGAIIGAL